MAVQYEKIDMRKKSDGLSEATIKMGIDGFDVPYEKIVTLEYRPDRPEYFEKNLINHTEEFIAEIKEIESVKAIDISKSLDLCAFIINETAVP